MTIYNFVSTTPEKVLALLHNIWVEEMSDNKIFFTIDFKVYFKTCNDLKHYYKTNHNYDWGKKKIRQLKYDR